ncbi:MAG: hypothetical protein AMXMBFR84_36160 [Candidatus Hydrogenedentota bacterium]
MSDTPADQLARDYENLYRSYLGLRRQVDHLSILREIGVAISTTLNLDEALTLIANVVQGALEVRRVTIYQLDKTGKLIFPVIAKFGEDLIGKDRLDEDPRPWEGSIMGRALAARRVHLDVSEFECAALVPLIAQHKLLGVMLLQDPKDGEPFTEDDAFLFQSLGQQIAIAINNAQLYALAVTDGLTGLYVRRYFDLRMDEEFDQAKRYGRPFSVLLSDIDHFKKFNDTHGHQTGDMVLQQFAALLEDRTRKADICCRYGGEEMSIILPETRMTEASVLANKLCQEVRNTDFKGQGPDPLRVTTSIGVAEYETTYDSPGAMVKAADEALYRAKELGRNRVELAGL